MTGVLKSSVMTLRPGCSAEDVLKTVTSLELEDGSDLDGYVDSECWWGFGRKTDAAHVTLYKYTYILYYNYVIYKVRPIYIYIYIFHI
jgi:hypothetical protein